VQISLSVPYDAQLLRRTMMFLSRSLFRLIRVLGGVITVAGLLLVALDPAYLVAYVFVACGVVFTFGLVPFVVARTLRMQAEAVRQDFQLTLDDEQVRVSYPLVESRFRWAALDRVVETPEVWYLMFGKIQAIAVPKSAMAPEQRDGFAALVARRRPAATR
jgi:hypothetical protein